MQSLRLHQGFFWVACLLALLVLTVTTPTAQANEGLDIDQDGSEAPLTDGLLIIRHLFGFTGTALSQGATASDAQRADPSAITQYLNDNLDTLDIDASGDVTPAYRWSTHHPTSFWIYGDSPHPGRREQRWNASIQ